MHDLILSSRRFIKVFEYKELGCGQNAWVLNNLEISSKIILKIHKEHMDAKEPQAI
jgi:hypothetical protein